VVAKTAKQAFYGAFYRVLLKKETVKNFLKFMLVTSQELPIMRLH
jgi:hypothetical protein